MNLKINPKSVIFIFPVIYIIWNLYLMWINDYYFLYHTDPEYPYLINGLNAANLHFNQIGHTDHPGTPFQILTAIFLRITHLFVGRGNIVDDVISRPEMYLSLSSFYLSIITMMIITWHGRMVLRITGNPTEVLFIQASLFLNTILMDVLTRYIPDRLEVIIVLICIGVIFKYFYDEKANNTKIALLAGLLVGVGCVTKINFLPVVIVGILILRKYKDKLIYLAAFSLSAFISFLPIINKHYLFRNFISKIIHHDGLYGQGSEQIINIDSFLNNIVLILKNNLPFSIALILATIVVIILLFSSSLRKKQSKEYSMLLAFISLSLVSIVMISKHYKNYYVAPMVAFTGLIFYLIWKILKSYRQSKVWDYLFTVLLIILIFQPLYSLIPRYKLIIAKINTRHSLADYCMKNISKNDYIYVEPTWMTGPIIENGLVYGFSYCAHHHIYYNYIERYYPNILTWEGENNPIKFFRMIDADIESVLKSGKNIYILSTPGRHAYLLSSYLQKKADDFEISYKIDTVYSNAFYKEYLIKYTNTSGWEEINSGHCGFEKVFNDALYTDDERIVFTGSFHLSDQFCCNGNHSLILNEKIKSGLSFKIPNISKGDYLEFTIKHSVDNEQESNIGELVLLKDNGSGNQIEFSKIYNSVEIKSGWILQRMTVDIADQPVSDTIGCYIDYEGSSDIYVDDFVFKHFSEK